MKEKIKKRPEGERREISRDYHITVDKETGKIKETLVRVDYEPEADYEKIKKEVFVRNLISILVLEAAIVFVVLFLSSVIPF